MAKKQQKKTLTTVALVVVFGMLVFGGLSTLFIKSNNSQPSPDYSNTAPGAIADPSGLPGLMKTPAPWLPEINNLRARLSAIGLPALAQEGTALHIHQHLDIFVDGKSVPVPAGIGIDTTSGFISPIHTHDTTGVIHVESPTIENFYLGQFFDIWGLRFTDNCLGSYCTSGAKKLRVYINGSLVTGDPRQTILTPHEEIVVAYGTDKELPSPIPASYSFSPGL